MLLIGGLNSTLGGKVIAQIERNVYASKGRKIVNTKALFFTCG